MCLSILYFYDKRSNQYQLEYIVGLWYLVVRPSELRHLFCGKSRPTLALLYVSKRKPDTDPDAQLFQAHHSLKQLHCKSKRDLRQQKRKEYAKAKGLK